jgi:hypothetical protein
VSFYSGKNVIILNRQVDEWIVIGERLRLAPTDIDSGGARIIVRGELIGGADDGAPIDRSYELAIGSSLRLGALVNITLMKTILQSPLPPRAQFGIQVPPKLIVQQKEIVDRQNKDAQ